VVLYHLKHTPRSQSPVFFIAVILWCWELNSRTYTGLASALYPLSHTLSPSPWVSEAESCYEPQAGFELTILPPSPRSAVTIGMCYLIPFFLL
jgi:hypothetical protein